MEERGSKRPRDEASDATDAYGRPVVADFVTVLCDNLIVREAGTVKHLDANVLGAGRLSAQTYDGIGFTERVKKMFVHDLFSDVRVMRAMVLFLSLVDEAKEKGTFSNANELAFLVCNGIMERDGGGQGLAEACWRAGVAHAAPPVATLSESGGQTPEGGGAGGTTA